MLVANLMLVTLLLSDMTAFAQAEIKADIEGAMPKDYNFNTSNSGHNNTVIPIHEYKGREFNLPMTLNYTSSGIKVDQVAGNVGLGWQLGFGGRIDRIVVSTPDHYTTSDPAPAVDCLSGILMASDTRDFYLVNAFGFSDVVKFPEDYSLGVKTSLVDPYTKYTTTRLSDAASGDWMVTSRDGTQYYFGQNNAVEKIKTISSFSAFVVHPATGLPATIVCENNVLDYDTGWMLTKIVSKNGLDVYEFKYQSYEWSQYIPNQGDGYRFKQYSDPDNLPDRENLSEYKMVQQMMTEVWHNGEKIMGFDYGDRDDLNFTAGGNALQNINFYKYKSTDFFKRAHFDYTYFGNPTSASYLDMRLKLDTVTLKGFDESNGEVDGDRFSFDYINAGDVPSITSYARDYIGLYNGRDNNNNLIPETINPAYSSKRDYDFESSLVGTLESVTLPTGGTMHYEYEQNALTGGYGNHRVPAYTEEKEVVTKEHLMYKIGGEDSSCPYSYQSPYDSFHSSMVSPNFSAYSGYAGGYFSTINFVESRLIKVTQLTDAFIETSGKGIYLIQKIDNCVAVNDNEQACIFENAPDKSLFNPCMVDTDDIYFNGTTSSQSNVYESRGLTTKLTGNDPVPHTFTPGYYQVTLWDYADDINHTSKVEIYKRIVDTVQIHHPEVVTSLDVTSDYVDGFRIKSITTHTGDSKFAGRKLYRYNGGEIEPVINHYMKWYPFMGEVLFVNSKGYASAPTMIKYGEVYEANVNDAKENNGYIVSFHDTKLNYPISNFTWSYVGDTYFSGGDNKFSLKEKRVYNNLDQLKSSENYFYGGEIFRTKQFGTAMYESYTFLKKIEKTEFPDSSDNNSAIYSSLSYEYGSVFYPTTKSTENYKEYYDYEYSPLNPEETNWLIKDLIVENNTGDRVSKTHFERQLAGTGYFVKEIHKAKGNDALEKTTEFEYDSDGNQVTKIAFTPGTLTDASYECTVYGYSNRFPIAKISGVKYSQLPSAGIHALKVASNAAISPANEIAMQAALKGLRDWVADNYPEATITTMTYDPVFGITSQTEPNGQTAFFEYDALGRLQYTKKLDVDAGQKLLVSEKEYHTRTDDGDVNWVKETVYKNPVTDPISEPAIEDATISMVHLDGLGRPVQQLAHRQSHDWNLGEFYDLKTHIGYDEFGRQPKEYLSYTNMDSTLKFDETEQETLQYAEHTNDNPFTEKEFDGSPMNRIKKIAAPGNKNNWAMGWTHEIEFDYKANIDDDSVRKFEVGNNGALVESTPYIESSLYKTITTDENDNLSEEFKNTKGQLILKRAFDESGGTLDTYYCYDKYDNLAFVIPPMAGLGTTITGQIISDLCYEYKYDQYNRLVEKKLPGKQPEFIVYDRLNRIVATGPAYSPFGTDSVTNKKGWLYTFYDSQNRVAYTGWKEETTIDSSTRGDLQHGFDIVGVKNAEHLASSTTLENVSINYTDAKIPLGMEFLTINYYDNYNFPHNAGINFSSSVLGQAVYYNNTAGTLPTGMPTGTWVRVLEPGPIKAETAYTLYDQWARPVGTYKTNYMGGHTRSENLVNFQGQTLQSIVKHKRDNTGGSLEVTTDDTFSYYSNGSLKDQTQDVSDLSGHAMEQLRRNKYSLLGRLSSKDVGGTAFTPLQTVDYQYNIRGWLTQINDVANTLGDDLFALRINYDQVGLSGDNEPDADNVSPLYNGNISETYWRSASDDVLRRYGYKYDALNRMREGIYAKPTASVSTNSYYENVNYDENGNITDIIRNGDFDLLGMVNQIDNLNFNYDPGTNKLLGVYDDTNSGKGFKDNAGATLYDTDYTYDDNGNMITDNNKGITQITYNHLNLPVEIIFGSSKIAYLYTATGQKIKKEIHGPSGMSGKTDYLDGFQYLNEDLKQFPTAEGYVSCTRVQSGYKFHHVYNYTDHLGNIRLSYGLDEEQELTILSENHYYPFGLKHTNYNPSDKEWATELPGENVVLKGIPPGGDPGGTDPSAYYKYKFNGQEWQDELGLNMTAMDFRQYDNAIGRFMGIDALSEVNYSQSPYHFGDNNPVYWADPTGLDNIVIRINFDEVVDGTSINFLYTQNDINNATGDLYLHNQNGMGLTYIENSLPAVNVGYNALNEHYVGNLDGILSSHVYSNSQFYDSWRGEQRGKQWDDFQSGLDWLGAVPIIGEGVDLINAGIYLGRGRYRAAALSTAAMVPFVGSAMPALKQSHHIIPKAVYKEFKSDLSGVMKLNGTENLMELPVPFHGNHPKYSDYVRDALNELKRDSGITPGSIEALQGNLRGMIDDALQSGLKLNDYFR